MASATPSYASTKETTNYARLCRLLVDVGSQVLRDKFDSIHPPAGLHGVLTKPPVHPTLQNLRGRKILNPTQWAKLYPTNPLTLSSKDFDVAVKEHLWLDSSSHRLGQSPTRCRYKC